MLIQILAYLFLVELPANELGKELETLTPKWENRGKLRSHDYSLDQPLWPCGHEPTNGKYVILSSSLSFF